MNPPHGPLKIGANRQITLPADLMRRINLEAGDSVYVAVSDDMPELLHVIPVEVLVTWLETGRRGEADARGERPASDRDESGQ